MYMFGRLARKTREECKGEVNTGKCTFGKVSLWVVFTIQSLSLSSFQNYIIQFLFLFLALLFTQQVIYLYVCDLLSITVLVHFQISCHITFSTQNDQTFFPYIHLCLPKAQNFLKAQFCGGFTDQQHLCPLPQSKLPVFLF